MATVVALAALAGGVALIVVGAEVFAEHLEAASRRLGVSAFALALLLAGAEPEELATTVAASLRKVPAIAFGDVIGANVAMCLVALPVGALVAPLPFGPRVRRYALLALPLGVVAAIVAWNGRVGRPAGALLVALYVAYVAAIWVRERRPPALGEVAELADTGSAAPGRTRARTGARRRGGPRDRLDRPGGGDQVDLGDRIDADEPQPDPGRAGHDARARGPRLVVGSPRNHRSGHCGGRRVVRLQRDDEPRRRRARPPARHRGCQSAARADRRHARGAGGGDRARRAARASQPRRRRCLARGVPAVRRVRHVALTVTRSHESASGPRPRAARPGTRSRSRAPWGAPRPRRAT